MLSRRYEENTDYPKGNIHREHECLISRAVAHPQVPTCPRSPASLSALLPHRHPADPQGPSSPNTLRHNSKSTVTDTRLNQIPEVPKSTPFFCITHITHAGSTSLIQPLLAVSFPIHILLSFLYLLYYDLYVFLLKVASFSLVIKTLHEHFVNSC